MTIDRLDPHAYPRHIGEIHNPFVVGVSYTILRELAYVEKSAGKLWPWTPDTILAGPRGFTCVQREHDATTTLYARLIREPLAGRPELLPATYLFQLFNSQETAKSFFEARADGGPTPFEEAMMADSAWPLKDALIAQRRRGVACVNTGAYLIYGTSEKGVATEDGLLGMFLWFLRNSDWRSRYDWLCRDGVTVRLQTECYEFFLMARYIAEFTAGQFLADLRYADPWSRAVDLDTFVVPGPGSRRGLNFLCSRPLKAPWDDRDWRYRHAEFRDALNPRLEAAGYARLHAANCQNVACELGKMAEFLERGYDIAEKGNFKRPYRPRPEFLPPNEAALYRRLEEVYEVARPKLLRAGVPENCIVRLDTMRPDMLTLWRGHQAAVARESKRPARRRA
jgi:hypothetical protein